MFPRCVYSVRGHGKKLIFSLLFTPPVCKIYVKNVCLNVIIELSLQSKSFYINVATTKIRLYALILFLAVLLPQKTEAQVFDNKVGVDTLSLAERISLRTNVVDWALVTPNIGVEFDVKNTNWNRWAVGLTLKSRWKTSSTFKQGIFYSVTEARLDFRNYWRTRQIDNSNENLKAHTNFIDKLFSQRRRVVKHPKTIYYRGVYASYTDFSLLLGRHTTGRQGKALSAGVTYGIIKPLYTFRSGNSLDLDLGFDAGLVFSKVEQYKLEENDDCFVRTKEGKWKITPFPLPTNARVGLVYRFGKYPSIKKYRWRYDCDAEYQYRLDTIASNRRNALYNKHIQDSIQGDILREFWSVYDSVSSVNAKQAEVNRIEAAKQKAEADRQAAIKAQQEKERQKAEKEAAKKEAEEQKTKEKAAEEQKPAEPQASSEEGQLSSSEEGQQSAESQTSSEDGQQSAEPQTSSEEGQQSAESQTSSEEDQQAAEPQTSSEESQQTAEPQASSDDGQQSAEPQASSDDGQQTSSDEQQSASTTNNTNVNNSESDNETEGKEATNEQ